MSNRVLLTGGAGFIGAHVIDDWLQNTDWDIVVLDRLDVSGNLNRIYELESWQKNKSRLQFIWHDLKSAINDMIARRIGEVDYIFHLAAGSHVDRSILYPMEFCLDNVVGTVNLLDFARTLKTLKKFNTFSTDESYGPAPEGVNFEEGSSHNPNNPYAASKAAAEDFSIAYHNTYKLPVFRTNTMNVFGYRQHPEKFIPKVIRSVLREDIVPIHADATRTKAGTRFWIFAGHVAAALRFLAEKAEPGGQYHIVGEREVDNLTLAQMIAGIVGKPLKYEMVDFHSQRPGHDLRYGMKSKYMAGLGWKLPTTFEQSLEMTVKWYLDNRNEWL